VLSPLGCSKAGDPACARGLGAAAGAGGRQLLARLGVGSAAGCPGPSARTLSQHRPQGRALSLPAVPVLAGGTGVRSQGWGPCGCLTPREVPSWDGGSEVGSKVSWGGSRSARRDPPRWEGWLLPGARSEQGSHRLGRALASFGTIRRPCSSPSALATSTPQPCAHPPSTWTGGTWGDPTSPRGEGLRALLRAAFDPMARAVTAQPCSSTCLNTERWEAAAQRGSRTHYPGAHQLMRPRRGPGNGGSGARAAPRGAWARGRAPGSAVGCRAPRRAPRHAPGARLPPDPRHSPRPRGWALGQRQPSEHPALRCGTGLAPARTLAGAAARRFLRREGRGGEQQSARVFPCHVCDVGAEITAGLDANILLQPGRRGGYREPGCRLMPQGAGGSQQHRRWVPGRAWWQEGTVAGDRLVPALPAAQGPATPAHRGFKTLAMALPRLPRAGAAGLPRAEQRAQRQRARRGRQERSAGAEQ